MGQKLKENFMDRKHGAYGIYHFCFGFSNLFPVKSLSPIAKDRQINAVKAVSICFTCLEPVTVKVPRYEAVAHETYPELPKLQVEPPGSLFLLAALSKELGQTLHSWVQGFIFSCVLPLAWCIALGKLLNLAKTLLFPLQSGVNSGHPSPLALRCWDEKCCRDSGY